MAQNLDFQNILDLIQLINSRARTLTKGPDCLDPRMCNAKCCYTTPDLPKTLVDHYIQKKWMTINQCELSNTMEYRLKLNSETRRCTFYDLHLNGCLIHATEMKPPQCTLYPFKERESKHICRNQQEFFFDKTQMPSLMQAFDTYFNLAEQEFKENASPTNIRKKLQQEILPTLKTHKPTEIEGMQENTAGFHVHFSTNRSYEGLDYCDSIPCDNYYEDCPRVCNTFVDQVIEDLITSVCSRKANHQITDEYRLHSLVKRT